MICANAWSPGFPNGSDDAVTWGVSRPSGGVQSVMCDASGRFFSDTIDINVWRALSTARGREVVGSF